MPEANGLTRTTRSLHKELDNINKFSTIVKAFVVTPQNDKKFHNFQRGSYDKGYKIFIADENLFVSILIFYLCPNLF